MGVYYPLSEEPREVLYGFITVYSRFCEEHCLFAEHAEAVKHLVWKNTADTQDWVQVNCLH